MWLELGLQPRHPQRSDLDSKLPSPKAERDEVSDEPQTDTHTPNTVACVHLLVLPNGDETREGPSGNCT